jgi:hypothetical protein
VHPLCVRCSTSTCRLGNGIDAELPKKLRQNLKKRQNPKSCLGNLEEGKPFPDLLLGTAHRAAGLEKLRVSFQAALGS